MCGCLVRCRLSRNSFCKSLVGMEICFFPSGPKLVLVGGLLSRNSFCKSLVGMESGFFPSGPKLVLVGGLLRNWIREGRVSRAGAGWDWDKLAVNGSIVRWRRVRLMPGTWGAERRGWKRGLRVRIEARLAVFFGGQASRGRRRADGGLRIARGQGASDYFIFSQADSGASDGAVSAARSGGVGVG
jgi:hypothetical protein